MNILILTPDRVGSTLLQRVITIYMNNISSNTISKPVVNLHELTNGIETYYSVKYQMNMTGKSKRWGYYQSLPEISELLKNTAHTVTGRLTHYHLERRSDSIIDQTNLYQFINNNFFVISAQRNSVFEYALSWGIKEHSDKLNVYSHREKIVLFSALYKDQITVDAETFINHLNAYKKYQEWTDTYFNVDKFFVYEDHMPEIESFVSDLDCFKNDNVVKWHDMFGIDWNDWNRCHRLLSDIASIDTVKLLAYNSDNASNTLPCVISQLPVVEQKFLNKHATNYFNSVEQIAELVDDRVLTTGIPIKLQTLIEKKMIIKNFNECAVIYNEWATKNNYPIIKDADEIINQAQDELTHWYKQVPVFNYSNLKFLK